LQNGLAVKSAISDPEHPLKIVPEVSFDHCANGTSTITPVEDLQDPAQQSGEGAPTP